MNRIASSRILASAVKSQPAGTQKLSTSSNLRKVYTEVDSIMPKPQTTGILGYLGLFAAVTCGLSAGAHLSKNIASFLEENELFVPSDDDDDD